MASWGRKLNAKLADSKPTFLGSNPSAPANSRKVGTGTPSSPENCRSLNAPVGSTPTSSAKGKGEVGRMKTDGETEGQGDGETVVKSPRGLRITPSPGLSSSFPSEAPHKW